LLVHPASVYVGLKSKKPYVLADRPIELEAIAVDLDGKAVPGRPIDVEIARLEWRQKKGQWSEEAVDAQKCALKSANDSVPCEVTPKAGGRHRVRALVADAEGRKNQTEINVWVAGEKIRPTRDVEQETAELIPDKRDYRPGDTAEVLVRAPFAPAEGVMTLRRSGVVETQRFSMNETSHVLRVPITDAYVPNVAVHVELAGSAPRADDEGNIDPKLPRRPAFATGELNLEVSTIERKLEVVARPKSPSSSPTNRCSRSRGERSPIHSRSSTRRAARTRPITTCARWCCSRTRWSSPAKPTPSRLRRRRSRSPAAAVWSA
jgi:uncharacterized protein YfaS (alpha-2-macroglobulin family)